MTQPRVGLVVCSQRSPRAGQHIGEFVSTTLRQAHPSADITTIDLAEWNLPIYNEPEIPSQIESTEKYVHEHTKAWSREISSYKGFIFVTPQYNWGYPASVKNAIDYLYHEWKGKPAFIVSYGGHGGGKAAQQLRQVLQGVRMIPTERMVALTFPDKEVLHKAARGEDLLLNGKYSIWEEKRKEIEEGFAELDRLVRDA